MNKNNYYKTDTQFVQVRVVDMSSTFSTQEHL